MRLMYNHNVRDKSANENREYCYVILIVFFGIKVSKVSDN